MSIPQPPLMRASIEDRPDGLCLIVPARRQMSSLIFVPFQLAISAMVVWFLIATVWDRISPEVALVFIVVASASALWTLFTGLWMLAGQERIVLGPAVLSHRYELFGVGHGREYVLANMRGLRAVRNPKDAPLKFGERRFFRITGGVIVFDYPTGSVRMGASLDYPEGVMIVDRLKERYGFGEADAAVKR